MAKRKTTPPMVEAPAAPEQELTPAEGDAFLGRSRLQQEVDAINSAAEKRMTVQERKELDARRAALEQSQVADRRRSRSPGASEPPSGISPSAGKVPEEVAEALKRALDVRILDTPLGLVFKTQDAKMLLYLDQVKNGEFVLRPYWKG